MKYNECSEKLEYFTKILTYDTTIKHGFKKNFNSLDSDSKECIKTEINKYYFEKGFGLKLLSRNVLGISYSNCRSLFGYFNIEFRKGYSVCTELTKEIRKIKCANEFEQKTGWCNPNVKRKNLNLNRGVQGRYFNKSKMKYVWLRSTWEYIYAKFLDNCNEKWDVEIKKYLLSNGEYYTPDFFIFDENWNLKYIVEIKGFYKDKLYKVDILKNQIDTPIIVIDDINQYCNSYKEELKTWKLLKEK